LLNSNVSLNFCLNLFLKKCENLSFSPPFFSCVAVQPVVRSPAEALELGRSVAAVPRRFVARLTSGPARPSTAPHRSQPLIGGLHLSSPSFCRSRAGLEVRLRLPCRAAFLRARTPRRVSPQPIKPCRLAPCHLFLETPNPRVLQRRRQP
jgi:hypothetical protein